MKQLLVLILICGAAFTSLAQMGNVHFTIKNAPSDSCVIAYYFNGKRYVLSEEERADDEEVVNKVMTLNASGKGTFTHKEMPTGMYMLVFLPSNDVVEFLYEGKSMSLSFDYNAIASTLKTDSKANEVLYKRTAFIEGLGQRKKKIDDKVQADPTYNADADYALLDVDYAAFNAKLYKDYPENLAVKFFKGMDSPIVPEELQENDLTAFYYYRSHYFDHIDFTKGWTLRTSYFAEKVDTYIGKLTPNHPDSIIAAWDYLIGMAKGNEEMVKVLVIQGLNTYAVSKTMGHDAIYCDFVDTYYLSGKATWADEEQIEKLRRSTAMLRNNLIGRIASNFTILTSDKKELRMLEIKEDYCIVLFAQNDCGMCKVSETDLKELQASIPENVKVVEVLYTTDIEQAISKRKESGVYWEVGVVGREFDLESTRENYDLVAFPRVYVLDKDKRIIAKRVSIEQALDVIQNQER